MGKPGFNILVAVAVIGVCVWVSQCVDFDTSDARSAKSQVDTAGLRTQAADVVRAAGYWCDPPTELREGLWGQSANRTAYVLVCDDGADRFARYEIAMNPTTGAGSVRPL